MTKYGATVKLSAEDIIQDIVAKVGENRELTT